MKERLGKTEFINRVRRLTVGEWYINQSALSFKKLASLMRVTETNVYIRSHDREIIEGLDRCHIKLKEINNLKSFIYEAEEH